MLIKKLYRNDVTTMRPRDNGLYNLTIILAFLCHATYLGRGSQKEKHIQEKKNIQSNT